MCQKYQVDQASDNCPCTMSQASVASSRPKLELDSHVDTCVVGDKCFVINDYICSYDPKDGHKFARTVNATVFYDDPQSGQKYSFMINQVI